MPVYQNHTHFPAHRKWERDWGAAHSLLRTARVEYITPTLNQLSWVKWQGHTVAARESENVVSSCLATYLAKILLLWKKRGGFGGTAVPHQLSSTHYSFIFSDAGLDLWPFRPRATISDTRILRALGKRQDKQLCCLYGDNLRFRNSTRQHSGKNIYIFCLIYMPSEKSILNCFYHKMYGGM